jgi:hypothetical protein
LSSVSPQLTPQHPQEFGEVDPVPASEAGFRQLSELTLALLEQLLLYRVEVADPDRDRLNRARRGYTLALSRLLR